MTTMLRIRANWIVPQGGPYLCTFYFATAGATATQTEAQNAEDSVGTFLNAIKAVQATTVSYATTGEAAEVNTDGVLTNLFTVANHTGTGATAAQALPYAAQALVRWSTGVFIGGKQVKGRTFIPGITKNGDTDGRLDGATKSTIQTAANAFNAATNPPLCIWSKANAISAIVTGASVWDQFAVLRSRRD